MRACACGYICIYVYIYIYIYIYPKCLKRYDLLRNRDPAVTVLLRF